MALGGKMQAYAEARSQGLPPYEAALHAGYAGSGIRVTTSRIEARKDVQAEIRRLKKGGSVEVTARKGDGGNALDPMEKWGLQDSYTDPLSLMLDVMNNPAAPKSLRYQAAKDALPYCHARKEGGKKEEQGKRAKEAAQGRFGTQSRPSHLKAVG